MGLNIWWVLIAFLTIANVIGTARIWVAEKELKKMRKPLRALKSLKNEIGIFLMGHVEDHRIEKIKNIIDKKIKELKSGE